MKTKWIAIIVFVFTNSTVLFLEPFSTFFKQDNVWLLIGINLLFLSAYAIGHIIQTMKDIEKRDFKIQILP